jgi:hypothetical protein
MMTGPPEKEKKKKRKKKRKKKKGKLISEENLFTMQFGTKLFRKIDAKRFQ